MVGENYNIFSVYDKIMVTAAVRMIKNCSSNNGIMVTMKVTMKVTIMVTMSHVYQVTMSKLLHIQWYFAKIPSNNVQ